MTSPNSGAQQHAIPEATPSLLANGRNVVVGEKSREFHRQRFIDQNAPPLSPPHEQSPALPSPALLPVGSCSAMLPCIIPRVFEVIFSDGRKTRLDLGRDLRSEL